MYLFDLLIRGTLENVFIYLKALILENCYIKSLVFLVNPLLLKGGGEEKNNNKIEIMCYHFVVCIT